MSEMSKTERKLRAYLSAIHPQYREARRLGKKVFGYLSSMLEAGDDPLAPRAVYLAVILGGPKALSLLSMTARHPDKNVRTMAAFVLPMLPSDKILDLLETFLADRESQVIYRAVRSAGQIKEPSLRIALSSLARHHPAAYVRSAAREALLHFHL